MGRKIDLTGQKFGKLTVIEDSNKRKNGLVVWKCKCECGNITYVTSNDLRSNNTKSCGCLRLSSNRKIDLTGKRFGKLVAIYPLEQRSKVQGLIWHCKCDCGNECDILSNSLRTGNTKSCGCTKSFNEESISKMLSKNNISFLRECKVGNSKNKFDFFIVDNKYFIEYDGDQHFHHKNKGWHKKENVKALHQRDLEKNKYCFDNNIPLIRIPYDADYTFEDLMLETTRFLLIPENEEEYYKSRMKEIEEE